MAAGAGRAGYPKGPRGQEQPRGRFGVQFGVEVTVSLAAPDQVSEVTRNHASHPGGRLAGAGLGYQGGRVGEQHAV